MSNHLAFTFPGGSVNLPPSVPQGGLPAAETYASNLMLIFLFAGICLTMIYIVWGGFLWTQSRGDKQKLESAKARITWAIIGFIILLLSYAIVNLVGYLFKVDLLKLT